MAKRPGTTTLIAEIPKAVDLVCHVREIEVDGLKAIELIDYVPSLEQYGRGYYVPYTEAMLRAIMGALLELVENPL